MDNTNLAISPSACNPQLTTAIPRLLPGELLARHVATLKAEDLTLCGWCGEPFLEGQTWMLDVYQQDGNSDTPIVVGSKPQVFKKTAVLMVHATDCLMQSCTKAVSDFTERVFFSPRKTLVMSEDEMRSIVWNQFRWAVRWVAWHQQYLINEPVDLVLGSRRPLLTDGVCPSFVLEMTKSHKLGETVHKVKAPMLLINRALIEALHTRVYEYEAVYKGKYQAMLQLKSAFDGSKCNTRLEGANVAVYAHSVIQGSYSSCSADEQHIKIMVKLKPSPLHMARLAAIYESFEDEVTWVMLHEHAQATKPDRPRARKTRADSIISSSSSSGSSSDDEDEADSGYGALVLDLLDDMQDSFAREEAEVNRAIQAAGVEVSRTARQRAYSSISSVALADDNRGHSTSVACISNCYTGSKASRPYYFFRDNHGEAEQPLFCFEGVMPGVVPIVVSSALQLADEMKEAAMARVELISLTVLMAHIRKGQRLRTDKSD